MATKETSSNKDSAKTPEPESEPKHTHRKRGYRGYPNKPDAGGGVHWGSGFAGVGSTSGGGAGLPGPGTVSERTQESVEKEKEEEEEEK
ncbi:MAG TPA: hypothetical protein VGL03_02835 [Thermoanaerobaculia bacterium]|jgi:hypothetical protein